jgi:hypothetical protein
MSMFLVIFVFSCGVLMVQINASGKYSEYEDKIRRYKKVLENLQEERLRLLQAVDHLESENRRLERLTHG